MGKLHEVLAVETDLKATADKLLKEAIHTLKDKATHFEASAVRFYPDEENSLQEAPEVKPMVDTLRSKIKYASTPYGKYIDAVFQKEATNQVAKADLVLEDQEEPFAKDVPATVLLGLETKLKEVRTLYEGIPTLAPGENWEKDEKSGHWKATAERIRTAKITEPLVTVQPTKEHPAQVVMVSKDVRKGRVVTTKESSVFTSAEKSELLGRVDTLIRAVKRARMRANNVDVVKHGQIGQKIFDYIHQGVV